ncbi:MAG: hydrolase [Candidatus Fimivivens sp.]|nr:hydrolase [Candidatus Fimivivens sp.]
MNFELLIENNGVVQMPPVLDGVTLTTERKGVPGKLTFTVLKDNVMNFTEGNPVRFTVDGKKIFYGFIFSKKRDREQKIAVTAYDQLRYLQNKDTYIYTKKTASDVIKMIAADFGLQLGEIEKTGFVITSRVEDNTMLFDVIGNALDLELQNKKQMFILYDDFGRLTLKSLDQMKVGLLIDEETGENFDYTSSIDDQTYNRVKLSYENEKTGKRDIYVMQDGNNINNWGVLQYFDTLSEGENGEQKAAALLSLYNAKTRKLKITKAFGDTRIRAGNMIVVKLGLGDVNVQNFMLVEKCVHTFNENEHWMDLTLRGGEFVG